MEQKNGQGLKVNKGISGTQSINTKLAEKFSRAKAKLHTASEYADGILRQDPVMLSKAITLIESSHPDHYQRAQEVLEKCLPYSGKSIRIGITGVPGAGKSSFIEALGVELIKKSHKLAILAVDPSSELSKGSILGDKTRMEQLSSSPSAFIRPSPSAGSLGGVARKTREIIILSEAAGYDVIFIETVGVGQSETAVHSMVDFFLLLMLAGAGDELQGMKRGIMEMADMILINKADGENINKAQMAKSEYQNALHLFPPKTSNWTPTVEICSAHTGMGIESVWNQILKYKELVTANGYFQIRRKEQYKAKMEDMITERLRMNFFNHEKIKNELPMFLQSIENNEITPYQAAEKLLSLFKSRDE